MCNFCKVQAICNGYRCSVSFWMTEKYTICVKEILVIVFMWMIITYFWEVTVLKGQACSKWPKQTYQIFHNFEWSRLLRGGCAWHFFLLFWVCFLGNYIALLLFKVLNYSSFEKKKYAWVLFKFWHVLQFFVLLLYFIFLLLMRMRLLFL